MGRSTRSGVTDAQVVQRQANRPVGIHFSSAVHLQEAGRSRPTRAESASQEHRDRCRARAVKCRVLDTGVRPGSSAFPLQQDSVGTRAWRLPTGVIILSHNVVSPVVIHGSQVVLGGAADAGISSSPFGRMQLELVYGARWFPAHTIPVYQGAPELDLGASGARSRMKNWPVRGRHGDGCRRGEC
jgi:hypothetical protein